MLPIQAVIKHYSTIMIVSNLKAPFLFTINPNWNFTNFSFKATLYLEKGPCSCYFEYKNVKKLLLNELFIPLIYF